VSTEARVFTICRNLFAFAVTFFGMIIIFLR